MTCYSSGQWPSGFHDQPKSCRQLQTAGKVLQMVEEPHDSAARPHLLATIPIRSERAQVLIVDFNAGFERIFEEEDRTGEDYDGRRHPRLFVLPIISTATDSHRNKS